MILLLKLLLTFWESKWTCRIVHPVRLVNKYCVYNSYLYWIRLDFEYILRICQAKEIVSNASNYHILWLNSFVVLPFGFLFFLMHLIRFYIFIIFLLLLYLIFHHSTKFDTREYYFIFCWIYANIFSINFLLEFYFKHVFPSYFIFKSTQSPNINVINFI